jgi:tripartite-type tricarboxylate transporter receptor subunit TctC
MEMRMTRIGSWIVGCAAAACLAAALPAQAQSYPTKPVRMSVGFAPGGIADIVTRAIAAKLSGHLGEPVVVENKPGADSRIALQQLIRETPDGHSLSLADSGLAVNALLYANRPYDPLKDFTPILYIGEVPNYIAVTPSLNVNTLKEFVDYAKARPGKLNYAATASSTLLAAELFKSTAGVDLVRVPYKGQALGLPALLAGDVHLMVSAVGGLTPMVKQGKIKALAVTGTKRTALAPEIPTAVEAGLPGMVYINWYVILGPAGLPRPVVERLNADLRKTVADPDVVAQLHKMGIDINPGSPEEFAGFLKSELAKIEKIVKIANLKVE